MNRCLTLIKSGIQNTLLFLAGETCLSCSNASGILCEECVAKLPWTDDAVCTVCALPLQDANEGSVCGECLRHRPAFKTTKTAFYYEDIIKIIMSMIKYNDKFYYCEKLINIIEISRPYVIKMFDQCEYMVPVPISNKRLRERGYNQSSLIARALSKLTGIPVLDNVLIKRKETLPQTGLSKEERARNIKDAFCLTKKIKVGKVLLVDDIITTTATVREASGVLTKGGVHEVHVFALCRTRD